jgi:hypothetical protein
LKPPLPGVLGFAGQTLLPPFQSSPAFHPYLLASPMAVTFGRTAELIASPAGALICHSPAEPPSTVATDGSMLQPVPWLSIEQFADPVIPAWKYDDAAHPGPLNPMTAVYVPASAGAALVASTAAAATAAAYRAIPDLTSGDLIQPHTSWTLKVRSAGVNVPPTTTPV